MIREDFRHRLNTGSSEVKPAVPSRFGSRARERALHLGTTSRSTRPPLSNELQLFAGFRVLRIVVKTLLALIVLVVVVPVIALVVALAIGVVPAFCGGIGIFAGLLGGLVGIFFGIVGIVIAVVTVLLVALLLLSPLWLPIVGIVAIVAACRRRPRTA